MKIDGRKYAVYATILGMELSWLYAIATLLNNKVAGGSLSVFGLLTIYLLAFVSNKALSYLRWHRYFIRTLSWLLWAVVALLTVKIQLFGGIALFDSAWLTALPQALAQIFYTLKPELLIVFVSIPLWWLGRRLAYIGLDFATAVAEFQFGLVMLLMTFFVGYELELDQSSSVFVALLFFFFALLGISITHGQDGKSWLSSWYQGHWSGLLLVSIGLILIIGVAISFIVTPDLIQLLLTALKWLWGMVEKLLDYLASLLPPMEPSELSPTPPLPGGGPEEPYMPLHIPEFLLSGLRLGWSILVFGIALLAIWRISTQIFSWLRRRMASQGGETEPLEGAFKADFLNWLRRILQLLGLKWLLKPRRRMGLILPEVASVRQIYNQLLRWAASGGYPRQKHETPYEYLSVLGSLMPENQGELDFITSEYVSARYGSSLPTDDELRQLKQKWHQLRETRLKPPDGKQAQNRG